MAGMPSLLASVSEKLKNATDDAVEFTKAERELLRTVRITVKYARKQLAFSVIRVGLTRDFIMNQISSAWDLEETEFDLYQDQEGKVVLTDEYLLVHSSPIVAFVKTTQMGFSDFSKKEALTYAGIAADDLDYDTNLVHFPAPHNIKDDNLHLIHAIDDLALKHELYEPIQSNCEYTKREFISPILALSAKIAGVKLACEEQLEGSKGKGPVDWVVKFHQFNMYVLLITEGKKDNLDKGVYQNLAQLTAASETTRRKRRRCPVDIPMYGVATTYHGWVFLRLDPDDGSERVAAQSRRFDISRSVLKATVKPVAEQLTGILMSQKKAIEQSIGRRPPKQERQPLARGTIPNTR